MEYSCYRFYEYVIANDDKRKMLPKLFIDEGAYQ